MWSDSRSLTRGLRDLFDVGTFGGLPDGELVERIRGSSEADRPMAEAAFEALMLRHGPMVIRICRGALREAADVEDAFQATFLVFARRLGSIRRRDSVASWLQGVAIRVSARARVEAARRGRLERSAIPKDEETPGELGRAQDAVDRAELYALIREELRHLPGRYREVLLLCYWEGLTQEEAARRLGCPIGTVRSRSARARDLLRSRLSRRGIDSPSAFAGIFTGAFSRELSPSGALPGALARSTVQAFVTISTGGSARELVSAPALALSRGVLTTMTMIKLKTALLATTLAGVGFLAAGRAAQEPGDRADRPQPARAQGSKPQVRKAAEAAQPSKPKAGKQAPGDYIVEPPDLVKVEVLDALPGRPITGERLVRPDGKISLGFYGDLYVAGLTLEQFKEKVILHLKTFLSDEALGLLKVDHIGDKQSESVAPKQSTRVFVDVVAYNSKYYYVQGDVTVPGRLPITGNETVLDAINFSGGLVPTKGRPTIVLIRPAAPGTCCEQTMAVDLPAIIKGNPTTNYQLQAGDRLVVYPDPSTKTAEDARPNRDRDDPKSLSSLDRRLHDLEGRIMDLDRKLDRVLEKLGQ